MAERDNCDKEAVEKHHIVNKQSPTKEYISPRKKYNVGSDVDKELVFDFPFISDEDTVSYIKQHSKIMFLIRGPPSTGKATLSEMLCEKYPGTAFCCADHFFLNSFNSPIRTRESLTASHQYCLKKVATACIGNVHIIIVQNTHMRKWEMQPYLDLAASHNYTVIMAITLYRFDVTPEALLANSPDGLNITYFEKRLRQWEHIPPFLTGWFISPNDTLLLHSLMMKSMRELIGDGKFCRVFDIYDTDVAMTYFKAKKLLFCLAGYTADSYQMKDYYLKPVVQDSYGKCFTITILGFYFTLSGVSAVVAISNDMYPLLLSSETRARPISFSDRYSTLQVNDNISHHNKTMSYQEEWNEVLPKDITVEFNEWNENENIKVFDCSFIHLAQKEDRVYDVGRLRKEFQESLYSVATVEGEILSSTYIELDGTTKICRLGDKEWLVKPSNKVSVKAVFTGLYI